MNNSSRAGGTANDGNAWRPSKSGETGSNRSETFDTDHVTGLQQSFAAALNQVDTGRYLTPKALYGLGGAGGEHYIAGINQCARVHCPPL